MAQPSFDSILNAVMQAESGGRRYDSKGNLLTSPKGAQGEMQVMPGTARSPGFGVEPAKSSSPEELARVGRDYLKTMLDRYGSLDRALVAYNWGPKNADAWIAKGADPAKLPAETQQYVSRVQSTLSAQPRSTAQAPSQPEAATPPASVRGAPRAAPARVSEARPTDMGPSYQAALALSFLSDEDEKESGRREYDEREPSVASQWLARETRKVTPESLAMPYRSPFAEPEPVKAADGGFIAVGYEDGGEVDAVASKSTEPPSRPEPFRVPPGQMEARLREFNRLDPATQSLITRDDPRVEFALTPAPASVSAPYTLSTMPGARALYDQTLAGTTTSGYVHPALKMQSRSGKEVAPQDVVFLRPGRDKAQELQSRAHEAEHLLAKRGLGDATAINDKFDELMKDSRARRSFVEGAVGMQPYLEKTYGTKSTYFMPEMLAFQDKRGRGANLLYEQFAELAAIEQATGKDLTKDPELRKTIFKDKKVREVYNAMTGLRQTRLDARDLAPYTPISEKPEGVMGFIRSKLGFADGGDVSAGSEEDILARAQAAAREGQAYRDMQEYLKTRGAVPDIEAGSLPSQTAAEFQRTILPVGAGTIKVNRGRLADRARETLPATLTHELAHAVDRQISQQAAEQAGMPNQFTEAYRKLVGPNESRRADIARKLDPAWEKRNRSYRSSPRELAGHGMGAFVDNAAQTPGPGHVDATAATELAILMDLANRNVDKKPKGLEKIPAFLRGIGYAEGGEAKSDEPTAEELERASKAAFGIVPSSGKGRKQSRVSDALQSGEAQLAAAKGLTMLPQNVVGAPVDIATLVARPFGYSVEKPVMGSEWLKEKSRAAGLAFQEPEDPTLRAFFQAGDISSNLINPAGATRTAVRGAEKTGEAAKMLAELATRPVDRDPFFAGPAGRQRGAVKPRGGTVATSGSIYQEPVSKLDNLLDRYIAEIDRRAPEDLDVGAVKEFVDKKVRKYFTDLYGTAQDPIRLAIKNKELRLMGEDVERIPDYLIEAANTPGMPGHEQAKRHLEKFYDKQLGIEVKRYGETPSSQVRRAQEQAIQERMSMEGVPLDYQNMPYIANVTASDVTNYPNSNEMLRKMLEAKQAGTLPSGQAFALEKGLPFYDVSKPSLEALDPVTVAENISILPPEKLKNMSFDRAMVEGAKLMQPRRDYSVAVDMAERGARVPKDVLFTFTKPVTDVGNQEWVQLTDTIATQMEGKLMHHSVGGYHTSETYGHGGIQGFKSGRAQIFSLRDKKNGMPEVTLEAEKTDKGLEVSQIKGDFNSFPGHRANEIFAFIDKNPNVRQVSGQIYTRNDRGEDLAKQIIVDWQKSFDNWKALGADGTGQWVPREDTPSTITYIWDAPTTKAAGGIVERRI